MVFNPEDHLKEIREHPFKNNKYVEDLYKKGLEEIEGNIIQMDEFSNYKDIDKDQAYVEKMKVKFEKQDTEDEKKDKKLATVLEAVVGYQVNQNCCFGMEVSTIHTCEYDDIANGVDNIVEVQEGKGKADHLAMATDETFSADIEEKIKDIKKDIVSGKLSTVKYFKSEFLGIKGEKIGIPKFILGVSRGTLEEISELWYTGKYKTLSEHPSQIMYLDQILVQLEYFRNFALGVNQIEIAHKYEHLAELFKNINENTKSQRDKILDNKENQKLINEDEVHQAIMSLKHS
jgi:hypothetical protein